MCFILIETSSWEKMVDCYVLGCNTWLVVSCTFFPSVFVSGFTHTLTISISMEFGMLKALSGPRQALAGRSLHNWSSLLVKYEIGLNFLRDCWHTRAPIVFNKQVMVTCIYRWSWIQSQWNVHAGVFVLVPLRRLFILRYRLTYPSGTATGTIINGFHTPLGEEAAKWAFYHENTILC